MYIKPTCEIGDRTTQYFSRHNIKELITSKTVNLKIPIEGKNSFLIESFSSSNQRRIC